MHIRLLLALPRSYLLLINITWAAAIIITAEYC